MEHEAGIQENGESYLTHYWLAIPGFINENKHKNSNGKYIPRSFQSFMQYFTTTGMLFQCTVALPPSSQSTLGYNSNRIELRGCSDTKTVTKQHWQLELFLMVIFFFFYLFFSETNTIIEKFFLYLEFAVCSKEILGSAWCVCAVGKAAGTVSVHTGGVTVTESSSLHRQGPGQSMNLHIEVKLCSGSF